MMAASLPESYPDNPVLASAWRGGEIESVHHGSSCLVGSGGHVLEQAGAIEHPFFTRSAIKALQVLPLFESGAAERYALTDEEVALALTCHLGADPARYLDFESESQVLVRVAVAEMCGVEPESLGRATDGCSAPTFRMSLRAVDAVRNHPVLLAGRSKRICAALVEASDGKLFPKIGAEAVYVIGVPGRDLGLAVKMDDRGQRGLHAVVIGLLGRFHLLEPSAADALESYAQATLRNWDGLVTGRITLP